LIGSAEAGKNKFYVYVGQIKFPGAKSHQSVLMADSLWAKRCSLTLS